MKKKPQNISKKNCQFYVCLKTDRKEKEIKPLTTTIRLFNGIFFFFEKKQNWTVIFIHFLSVFF